MKALMSEEFKKISRNPEWRRALQAGVLKVIGGGSDGKSEVITVGKQKYRVSLMRRDLQESYPS
ncbi:MAG: hypothetical protein K0S08_140 [Gammaproteobacteria bacterium]|jgi:hypothetical protein|nr:hypothetical protein [Gammaproteobacteria bacterium]